MNGGMADEWYGKINSLKKSFLDGMLTNHQMKRHI
jgi:hypothetical protein